MAKGLGTTLTKIPTSSITDSTIGITNLVTTGTASSSTFLKGDLSWGTVSVEGKINTAASDPASNTAGDIWYTGGKFKFAIDPNTLRGIWSSGGNLATSRKYLGACGTLSAGLCMGGDTGSVSNVTEEYNGTSWSGGGNIATARDNLAAAGTKTAGLCKGGRR